MRITNGTKLGRYEIRSKIGAGGMGSSSMWEISFHKNTTTECNSRCVMLEWWRRLGIKRTHDLVR
jgi:hypothetical protein